MRRIHLQRRRQRDRDEQNRIQKSMSNAKLINSFIQVIKLKELISTVIQYSQDNEMEDKTIRDKMMMMMMPILKLNSLRDDGSSQITIGFFCSPAGLQFRFRESVCVLHTCIIIIIHSNPIQYIRPEIYALIIIKEASK